MKTAKKWYNSKTIWAGVAAIAAAVAEALATGLDYKAVLLAGYGALAVVLRTVTKTEIE
jgi:hypothetical protein